MLQYRVADWKEYLLHKLIGAYTLQPSVHVKAKASFQRCSLQPGMWLEVVDRTCLSVMTVATVDKIVGSRVRLRYLQSEVLFGYDKCDYSSFLGKRQHAAIEAITRGCFGCLNSPKISGKNLKHKNRPIIRH